MSSFKHYEKERESHKALKINSVVAKTMASLIKSTLGPRCSNKMLINELGMITITNNGGTILNELKVEHPTAKLIINLAKSLKEFIGDGTTSSTILIGSILEKSYQLCMNGFKVANIIQCINIIRNELINIINDNTIDIEIKSEDLIFKETAKTIMNGKISEFEIENIATVCIEAINFIKKNNERNNDKMNVKDNIIQYVDLNKNIEKTEIIYGLALTAKKDNFIGKNVNKNYKNILLIDTNIEKKTNNSSKIKINSLKEKYNIIDKKKEYLLNIAKKIADLNVDIIFSTKKIPQIILDYFESNNILVFKPIEENIINQISIATSGKIVRNWEEINKNELGFIESLSIEEKNENENIIYLNVGKTSKIMTIIIRGETLQISNNTVECIDSTLGSLKELLENRKVVCGGGSIEMEMSLCLKKKALLFENSKQQIINKLADAFEEIPKQLALNGGYNVVDKLIDLRQQHMKGNKYLGINILNNGKIEDMNEKMVYESYNSKKYIILSALEISIMILRIDDILKGSNNNIYNKNSYNPNNYNKIK